MNDIARPVPPEEIEAWEAHGTSLLAEKAALLTTINRVSIRLNFCLMIVAGALALVILAILPLQKIIPVFGLIDGHAVQVVRDISELGDRKDDVVKSVLWTLVTQYQGYVWHGAKMRYDTVTALTTGKAQSDYQAWFRNDPASPQYTIGNRGVRHAEPIPSSAEIKDNVDTCRTQDWCEATLSFYRYDQIFGQAAAAKKHYTARIAFIFPDRIDANEAGTINPAGLKAISILFDCDDC